MIASRLFGCLAACFLRFLQEVCVLECGSDPEGVSVGKIGEDIVGSVERCSWSGCSGRGSIWQGEELCGLLRWNAMVKLASWYVECGAAWNIEFRAVLRV